MRTGLPALLLVAVMAPSSLAGQDALHRADSLAAEGRADAARETLSAWWDNDREDASRPDLQRGLWLRARLTVDPRMAAVDYQRLVAEYPGGRFTDAALLRLAQLERAIGRPAAGAHSLRLLLRDHPGSPHAATARELLPEVEAEDEEEAGEEVVGASVPAGEPSAVAIQLGAFASEHRARLLLSRAVGAGLDVRLVQVPENELVRVRTGSFTDVAAARGLRDEVRGLGFDAIVVEDAHRQEPVR